jgi:hypothetical protein
MYSSFLHQTRKSNSMNPIHASKKIRLMTSEEACVNSIHTALPSEPARSQAATPASVHSTPRLDEHTVTLLSAQTPRSYAPSSSSAPIDSNKLKFKDLPNELLPLIASFSSKPFQTLNAAWIARIDKQHKPPSLSVPEDLVINLVRRNGLRLAELPMAKRTPAICKAALQQNGEAWTHVPRQQRESLTLNLAATAVKSNGLTLGRIPLHVRTPAIKELAVKNNALAVGFLERSDITPNIYKEILIQAAHNGRLLHYLNEGDKTQEMYATAIKQKVIALRDVPETMRGQEIYRDAVLNDVRNISLVPQALKDQNLYLLALKNGAFTSVESIPEDMRNSVEFWMEAIDQSAALLHVIPSEIRAKSDIDKYSLNKNGLNLGFIYMENRTEEYCALAISQCGSALQFVPDSLQLKFLEAAVKQDNSMIRWVINSEFSPQQISEERYQNLFDLAVSGKNNGLSELPVKERTVNRCITAVTANLDAIQEVPAAHLLANSYLQQAAYAAYQKDCEYLLQSIDTPISQTSHALFHTPVESKAGVHTNYAPPIMIEHMLRLSYKIRGHTISNTHPLFKGIPEEWLTQTQVCSDLLAGFNFQSYTKTDKNSTLSFAQYRKRFSGKNGSDLHRESFIYGNTLPGAIFMAAINRRPHALERVPLSARTPALCLLAVKKSGIAIAHVPPPLRDEAICLAAFASAGRLVFTYISPSLVDQLS